MCLSDPIVKDQGRLTSMSGHSSPTPIGNSGQLAGMILGLISLKLYGESGVSFNSTIKL